MRVNQKRQRQFLQNIPIKIREEKFTSLKLTKLCLAAGPTLVLARGRRG